MGGAPAKVMIVDDSAVVRQVLTSVLQADPALEVVSAVADPVFAMARMEREWPDVLVLDIEMPRMDGLTFLRKIMAERPTPVVICSTLTTAGAETAMAAMAAGAVSLITKPRTSVKAFLEDEGADLVRVVKAAATSNMAPARAAADALGHARSQGTAHLAAGRPGPAPRLLTTTDRLVAIGTSTGGTQALEVVLTRLARQEVGVVVVQHMPEAFTAAYASRLNGVSAWDVAEASNGDRALPGQVLIAPGGRHMTVSRDGAQYRVRVFDGPRVNRHKPSVDVLFSSVAKAAGSNALGVIMTGMGDDGARGLLEMRQAGATTVAQDEASCVVYGMPGAARQLGAVETEVPLLSIPDLLQDFARRGGR